MIKKKKILFGLIFSFIGIIGIFIFSDVFKDNVKSDTVSIYLNNETADSIPLKNEAIFSKAICDDDVRVLWDNDKWGLLISNMTNKVKCNLYFYSGPTEFDFDYTGDVQTFTAPVAGTYKIAAWGASGGDVTINDATYQGGLGCQNCRKASGNTGNGYFGYSTIIGYGYGTGGGSGYYGGGTGGDTFCNVSSGAGGSSFISGHNGCDAIKKESTEDNIIHTGGSIHYSGLYFTNTVMIDGNGYNWTLEKGDYLGMPSHSDNSIIKGNHGNGYVRITMLLD